MKTGKITVFLILSILNINTARSQEQEIQQLLLNVEKLVQLKQILQDMYKGYQILYKGYTSIKDISQGNFNIHKTFLDDLLSVSPTVQKYKRVADIIRYQMLIMKQYKSAYKQFSGDPNFTAGEIKYMAKVFSNLSELTLKNLDDLTTVITAGKLRMSDDERIRAIDRIYADILDQWGFLKHFNDAARMLSLARAREKAQVDLYKKLSNVK